VKYAYELTGKRNNSNYTTSVVDLASDAIKEQNQVAIASKNNIFAAGDFALIDQADDAAIITVGDSGGSFSRKQGRVLSQRVEIASIDSATGILTLASPLHWAFKTSAKAQIIKGNYAVTKWAGIEHVWVQGGISCSTTRAVEMSSATTTPTTNGRWIQAAATNFNPNCTPNVGNYSCP
jgi:NADH dehydrogenase FAD-containing subunit